MSQYPAVIELSSLDGNNGFQILGESSFDAFGYSISSAGDVNGDGFDDIIIGARYSSVATAGAGYSAWVVFGKASGFDAVLIATDHDAVDYAALAAWAPIIVDTRNAFGRRSLSGANVVKA